MEKQPRQSKNTKS